MLSGWLTPLSVIPVPHEVTLVCATLAARFVRSLPTRLIGDNAYESDRLDANWPGEAWS